MTKDFLAIKRQQLCYTRSNSLPSGLGTELVQAQNSRMPSVTISDFSSTNHIDITDDDDIRCNVATANDEFQVTLEDIARHR